MTWLHGRCSPIARTPIRILRGLCKPLYNSTARRFIVARNSCVTCTHLQWPLPDELPSKGYTRLLHLWVMRKPIHEPDELKNNAVNNKRASTQAVLWQCVPKVRRAGYAIAKTKPDQTLLPNTNYWRNRHVGLHDIWTSVIDKLSFGPFCTVVGLDSV